MATTLEAIQAQMKKLQARADALMTKEAAKVVRTIHELMAKHGLTTADIDGHAGGKQRAKKVEAKTVGKKSAAAAKYRDPKTGATWTGHGRAPKWIASAKNRERFLVDGSTATAKPTPVSKVNTAGNYVRGPQPAMYRDPKSGATWSGRGRAPAWIAGAKDRTKFLIAGAAEATAATTTGAVSKAKAAVKKTSKATGVSAGKGQLKGAQPALYRDPKSGSTWSGRGRAPAWLAGAKDRSKFLIDAAEVVGDAKPAVTKAVAKKAPTAKKTAAKKTVSAKVSVNKAPAKRAPRKSVAVPASVATAEPSAESTT
ncbi:H-NS family nucleoid-associated regulatory protein [Paraburkholderia nemoris]|uniref:H-NS family nucleoid-associated regulatory protein n=1 Tax=Paraburkholderia nemoris TaxID=2793076 RepID=UPI0038BB22C5